MKGHRLLVPGGKEVQGVKGEMESAHLLKNLEVHCTVNTSLSKRRRKGGNFREKNKTVHSCMFDWKNMSY